jgi:hypothetical protein
VFWAKKKGLVISAGPSCFHQDVWLRGTDLNGRPSASGRAVADKMKSARRAPVGFMRWKNAKGALRFGLAAPMVAGDRFERSTFGL